jgi:hypothetical protein
MLAPLRIVLFSRDFMGPQVSDCLAARFNRP